MIDWVDFSKLFITFFTIMDPMGNVPVFLSLLKKFDIPSQRRIIFRESCFALFIAIFTLFLGEHFLDFFEITPTSLQLAGGFILFIIAITMVFPYLGPPPDSPASPKEEPYIVPLALPCIAGPSLMAIIMIKAKQHPNSLVLIALLCAWLVSTLFFVLAPELKKLLREKGMIAVERVMGFLLTLLSVEIILKGIDSYLKTPR